MTGKLLSFISLAIVFCACSKNDEPAPLFQGVWVEKTFRLDTFDFDKANSFDGPAMKSTVFFRSKPFNDSTLNPSYPINNSGLYSYYTIADSIFLRSSFSSSLSYKAFPFQITNSKQSFRIGKFYLRTGLVSAILEFERIQ